MRSIYAKKTFACAGFKINLEFLYGKDMLGFATEDMFIEI